MRVQERRRTPSTVVDSRSKLIGLTKETNWERTIRTRGPTRTRRPPPPRVSPPVVTPVNRTLRDRDGSSTDTGSVLLSW